MACYGQLYVGERHDIYVVGLLVYTIGPEAPDIVS